MLSRLSPFRTSLVCISILSTAVLVLAIGSFLIVPSWAEIWENLHSRELFFSIKLSLWTAALSSALVMLLALPIGYALSRFNFTGKSVVKTIMDLPVAFPELVLGLCLLLLFGKTAPGKWLQDMGLNFVFTQKGILAAQFFPALPYAIRIMKSSYDFINPRLEFVSRSLGYSEGETFINVTLPLAKSGIIAAGVISFARCIGTFGTVLVLAGGSAGKTNTLPINLYLNISYGNMGMAITSGIILIAVSFLAIFIFEKTEAAL